MEQLNYIQTQKREQNDSNPMISFKPQGLDHILKPILLNGMLVPQPKGAFDYKLVCSSGLEYFIVADAKWRRVLSYYKWEEVKFIGFLNKSNMTIIPQKIFPKGPASDNETVVSGMGLKRRDLLEKLAVNANELVFTPLAICAVMLL